MATKVFTGANVHMSRNLVPPELFDALHDALKLNGASVLLCCDPTRNAPNDYHVIASPSHEKFEDLRSKGCNLLGPQCVLSCAKEHRLLPKQGFTCCLAMDGVNILASGFEKEEKNWNFELTKRSDHLRSLTSMHDNGCSILANIAKMVTAMGGVLHTKISSDVSFVIVKNVLAQKYKWALNILKKPIVTINWLLQCWKEHRVVPQESYRVLPFSGLTICVSGIPGDERKDIEKLAVLNGGKYSAELTRRCTHLVCDAPEGDKYKVAKNWGHIHIITRKWFHQSVARRACLGEDSYPVQGRTTSSISTLKTVEQHSRRTGFKNSQYTSSSLATPSDSETIFSAQATEPELENALPNMYSSFKDAPPLTKEQKDSPANQQKNDSTFDQCVADDSQSDDDDLYLSECRILLVGFEASRLRVLVDMVRRGGGSRYTSFSEKLTHVIVGDPSESETKEVRSLAAFGVIYVVKAGWLEECNCQKKEVAVFQKHIAYDILLPKDPVFFKKETATTMAGVKQGKSSASQPVANNNTQENKTPLTEALLDVKEEAKMKVQSGVNNEIKYMKSSTVFKGKLFRFSSSFPEEQRPEIVQWVNEGGGEVVVDKNIKNVNFIVERHGVTPCLTDSIMITYVSSHWIHSCLEDGCLLDVGSHILYSPLPCLIPLPGFEGYRFCVSRYDLKERQLLRNLCYVLGGKFIEKLNTKVTHLLCKFAGGEKYEAACKWGVQRVTAEWIYECVMQNKVVDLNGFYPKDLTSQEREAGLGLSSQFPSQSFRITSRDDASQCPTQTKDLRNMQSVASSGYVERVQDKYSSSCKKARLLGSDSIEHPLSCDLSDDNSVHGKNPAENNVSETTRRLSSVVPDVAAAIEDLLEQTSKIQDQKSQETSSCLEKFIPALLGQSRADPRSDPGPSKHWVNRLDKKEEKTSVDAAARGFYDGFSETQTDSQVVGYEEDLSGRQMIIDRVRSTNSSMGTNGSTLK